MVSGHALEGFLKGGIIGGFPVEEPGAGVIRGGFFDVAETVAFELGVVVNVVDVVVGVNGIDGGFDGGVEGEGKGVHCGAAFDC